MTRTSHLELLQQFATIINSIPFNRILGLKIADITADHVTMNFDMTKDLIGNVMHGILHGGVISAVLDMTGGTAAMIAAIQRNADKTFEEMSALLARSSTINMHVDYLTPGKGQHFIAKAHVLHSGKKITFTRMELMNHEQVLIASGSAAYRVG